MGDATLAVSDDTKQRFDEYYHAQAYPSQDAAIDGMLDALPSQDDIAEGCEMCDRAFYATRYEELNAVVEFFYAESHDVRGTRLFCSAECAMEAKEEAQKYFPSDPEEIVVGGKDELRTSFTGGSFILDGSSKEVSLDVPGAFGGSDSHGYEYDYVGEPVYIKNEGEWVQDGVISDIIHEEAHTGLLLDRASGGDVKLHHPDPEVRKQFKEESIECWNCGAYYHHYDADNLPFDCPECGSELTEADLPDGHEPDDAESDGADQ